MGFGVWIRISSPSLKRNRWTRTALNLHCNDRICFNFEKCEIDKISEGGAEQTVALISGMWVCGQGHPDKLRVL